MSTFERDGYREDRQGVATEGSDSLVQRYLQAKAEFEKLDDHVNELMAKRKDCGEVLLDLSKRVGDMHTETLGRVERALKLTPTNVSTENGRR